VFGWYLTLKRVADSGIFTKEGMSAMKSAERANLWEAFMYLSADRAERKFANNLQKVNNE